MMIRRVCTFSAYMLGLSGFFPWSENLNVASIGGVSEWCVCPYGPRGPVQGVFLPLTQWLLVDRKWVKVRLRGRSVLVMCGSLWHHLCLCCSFYVVMSPQNIIIKHISGLQKGLFLGTQVSTPMLGSSNVLTISQIKEQMNKKKNHNGKNLVWTTNFSYIFITSVIVLG